MTFHEHHPPSNAIHPRGAISDVLAHQAAEASHRLGLVRAHRVAMMAAAAADPGTYQGPARAGDRAIIIRTLTKQRAGLRVKLTPPLRDLITRLNQPPPDDPMQRLAEVYVRIAKHLATLERYERQALARRRRRALDALDAHWEVPESREGLKAHP